MEGFGIAVTSGEAKTYFDFPIKALVFSSPSAVGATEFNYYREPLSKPRNVSSHGWDGMSMCEIADSPGDDVWISLLAEQEFLMEQGLF